MATETNTRWNVTPKIGVYMPFSVTSLIVECAEDYSFAVIGKASPVIWCP